VSRRRTGEKYLAADGAWLALDPLTVRTRDAGEWRMRHDGKAENIYETKEAAFEAAVAAASFRRLR
jgi:hypothetical protein